MANKGRARITPKRGPGRPPTTARGIPVLVRCDEEFLTAVDRWRARQNGEMPRPDAIRQLAKTGLTVMQSMKRRSPRAAAKASDMAGQQIDKMSDPSVTVEEQQKRKRRLLKGPGEFRDIRGDLAKGKG